MGRQPVPTLGVTLWRINIVLAKMFEDFPEETFEEAILDMKEFIEAVASKPHKKIYLSELEKLWLELAKLVTWAHIPPGIYADRKNSRTRERRLGKLEFLLADLLAGIEAQKRK